MTQNESHPVARPTPRALALVVLLGVASALWSLFQWTQLVTARTGGSSFCGLGDSTTCVDIWDSAFATAVQEWTGVPVAGWGLVWSLTATVLPLWALVGKSEAGADAPRATAWLATIWIALGGAVAVVVLIAASIAYGALCTTCALTYTLVGAYAATCFVQTPPLGLPLARGMSPAAVTLAFAFLLLFVPGLRTPMSQAAESRKAMLELAGEQAAERRMDEAEAKASAASPAAGAETAGSRQAAGSPQAAGTPQAAGARQAAGAPEDLIARLSELLADLPPQVEQLFADELLRYSSSEPAAPRPPRDLLGPADAPVRITEFTDALCGHCASLHETVTQLRSALPPGSFALDARHFPLDAGCNAAIEGDPKYPVRCTAARAKICLEGREGAFDYAHRLYVRQQGLTEEEVLAQAKAWMPREELMTCMSSDETSQKLAGDIAWAVENDIEGTPLVLINGRRVSPFGPLLYALVVTKGDPKHPVFDGLPQGVLRDPHEGHNH